MKDIVKKISKNIFIFPLLLVMLTLVIGVSYAYYEINFAGKKEVSLNVSGGISLTFNWNNTSYTLDDDKMSNEEGKEQDTYYEFSVSATASKPKNINYLIYLEEDQTNTIDNSNVFVYLTDDSDNMMKAPIKVNSLQTYQEDNTKSLFVNGFSFVKEGTKTHNYRLRSWLDEDSTQTGTYKYQVKVVMSEEDKSLLDQEGVYITSAKYLSDTSVDEALCEIENAYATKFDTNIVLSSEDNSSITYEITVYNSTNYTYYLSEIIKDEYTNEDITYTLEGFNINDEIESKESKTFTIVYHYKDGAKTNTLSADLDFIFKISSYIAGEYAYTGLVEEFTASHTGVYKIELWGAQGGSVDATYHGGYGGYATGAVNLKKGDSLYVVVGQEGSGNCIKEYCPGGYNGGGNSGVSTEDEKNYTCSGGGATHIATYNRGELYNYDLYREELLIVAGGGAGGYWHEFGELHSIAGGSGGGINGVDGALSGYEKEDGIVANATGGTQESPGIKGYRGADGSFGKGGSGASCDTTDCGSSGGGGGFYGGGASGHSGAGGGSGYIQNTNLTDKYMVCYNCKTSTEEKTKTITNQNISANPLSDYSKIGNGYAKITFLYER